MAKDINDTQTKEIKIAKTSAERQREYRERVKKEGKFLRVDTRINLTEHWHFEDLASFYKLTKREMLEKLISEEFSKAYEREDFRAHVNSKI